MTEPTNLVRAACDSLATTGRDITFAAVAEATSISRATLYRNRHLREIVDAYRARAGEQLTMTELADRLDNLTQTLDAVAARVRRHEEDLRKLKRGAATRPSPTRD